jgi:hypothetical protein
MGTGGTFREDKTAGGVKLNTRLHLVPQSKVVKAVKLLISIREVLGSNLDRGTVYPGDFRGFSSAPPAICWYNTLN